MNCVLLGEIPVELIKADESHALPAQGLHQLGADLSSATVLERQFEILAASPGIQRDVRFLTMFSNYIIYIIYIYVCITVCVYI